MSFKRPPRIQKAFGENKITFPTPASLSDKPKANWIVILLPLVGTGGVILLMVFVLGSTQSSSYLMFLPFLIPTVLATLVAHLAESRDYENKKKESLKKYDEQLKGTESKLASLSKKEREVALDFSPDILTCFDRIKSRNIRLGERRPTDHDFLVLRLGIGNAPSTIQFDVPDVVGKQDVFTELDQRAFALRDKYKEQADFPILLDMTVLGSVGIHGERDLTRNVARSLFLHLATHHWPSEVNVMVFSGTVAGASKWNWVNSLPHRTRLSESAVIPVESNEYSLSVIESLETELRRRQAVLYHNKSVTKSQPGNLPLPTLIILFDRVTDVNQHAAFSLILKKGAKLGVFGLFLADNFVDLPSECYGVVDVKNGEKSETGKDKKPTLSINLDTVSASQAEEYSQLLADIDWEYSIDITEPPENLTLFELLGVDSIDEIDIQQWWRGESPYGYLRAPIGKFTQSAEFILDLNEASDNHETHGPHGVIGGTTGSGKSELLRTIILSLALTHHPFDINFALIDYKGGGAFKDLETLPHVVGVITDIENHANYAVRVIESLTGEINSRKSLLGRAQTELGIQRPHIDDYRKLSAKRPLPRLVLIFDEYAEFKDKHPDETRKLINIARQGRSLGVHLILCTQNPSIAVDDQVRQNTRFAMSLSVNSADDSSGLIGIPDAFGLPRGYAFIKVINPQKFRVAYSGAKHSSSLTQATALVERICNEKENSNLPFPPRVWPNPLPSRLYLPDLISNVSPGLSNTLWTGEDWSGQKATQKFIIGLVDNPYHQTQPALYFGGNESGQNMIVIGGSKSGKSTFLLTLALSMAQSNSPSMCWIYILDLGGQSMLYKLKNLPHIAEKGGIIEPGEKERINRLFGELRTQIKNRRALLEKHGGASNIATYNQTEPADKQIPQTYFFIDSITSQFFDSMDGFAEQLIDVILEGSGVGINVVITANLPQDINHKIYAYISDRIILRPAEKGLVENVFEASPNSIKNFRFGQDLPPGRGFKGGDNLLELQVGLPFAASDDVELSIQTDTLITKMASAWQKRKGERPPSILTLPHFVGRSDDEMVSASLFGHLSAYFGISRETMKPIGVSLEDEISTFLVASSNPKRGKTTFLINWLINLAERYSPDEIRFLVLDFHRHSLKHLIDLPHSKFVMKHQDLAPSLKSLKKKILDREKLAEVEIEKNLLGFDQVSYNRKMGYNVIVIDDYNSFYRKSTDEERNLLAECITDGEDYGVRLMLAENSSLLGFPSMDDILAKVAQNASGIALGPYENLDNYFAQITLPAAQKTNDFPAGRAYFIGGGKIGLFQAQTYWNENEDPANALAERISRIKKKFKNNMEQ